MGQEHTDSTYEGAGLASAVHELHARLGSINIAVTAVTELELVGDVRDQMLTTASEEAVRASAELAGIGALAACALDNDPALPVDLGQVLDDVTEVARASGLDAKLTGEAAGLVVARRDSLRRALAAVLRIVAGPAGAVQVALQSDAARVAVGVTRVGAEGDALPDVLRALVAAFGARLDRLDDGLGFSFEVAP